MEIGFDSQKYINLQSSRIRERIDEFGGKLYLEFGGKLYDDYHASRVLPGFAPDNKLRMLLELKDQVEIVIAISANDIEKNKVRGDLGITYDSDVMRLYDVFRGFDFFVGSIAITRYRAQPAAIAFEERCKNLGLKVYRLYDIPDYPNNVELIVSEEGYGKNDYIQTERPLVVVTAPGPGSGKMAVCLSQLYHDHIHGVQAGYAKFETFPVWNLDLYHPINLAYESATADLRDVNQIDPYHLRAYNLSAVNYNRDVESFPVLKSIFESIYGESPYQSPTDMGVNMIASAIIDDEVCCKAAYAEIIRRYFKSAVRVRTGNAGHLELQKQKSLLKQLNLTPEMRRAVLPARKIAEETKEPAVAIELTDGRIVTGKTSELLGSGSAALLNALKELAGIPDEIKLISPDVIVPIQGLKTSYLGSTHPMLHITEILIALSICAITDPNAAKAYAHLDQLKGCEVHSTVILSSVDADQFNHLGMNVTCDPDYESNRLYHK